MRRLFFYLGVDVGVGVGGGLFLSLNRLIIIWYIVWTYVGVYIHNIIFRTISCGCNIFNKLGSFPTIFKIKLVG